MLDDHNKYQSFALDHYGIKQRWIVVSSEEARSRSKSRMDKVLEKQEKAVNSALKKLCRTEFDCKSDAIKALLNEGTTYLTVECKAVEAIKKYSCKGRPKPEDPFDLVYRVSGHILKNNKAIASAIDQGSCFVIGTSIEETELSAPEIIEAYKEQNTSVERGFRFLKDPIMFTSSLFLKKPSRIQGLLMVMTLALLVYSIAQRRLRQALAAANTTLPNQIQKETSKPTLRWVFQMLEGIDVVAMKIGHRIKSAFIGLTAFRERILRYFGRAVEKIYKLVPASARPMQAEP
jgi:transposase